ncbi:hypothetical protein C8Q76DRAFT_728763 [Earliella scabrosa]|nr:hypothetical protein C8Q76DRAFT_728763 [Earliella scabrosa]
MSQGPAPAAGYIAFVLLGAYPDGFYLNIPLDILRSIAAPGRVSKFLRYLAWEILYCDGIVIQVWPGLDVDRVMQDDDDVEDQAVYVFRPNPDAHISPINRDVVRRRKSQSTFAQRQVNTPLQLGERDGSACIFTGTSAVREAERCNVFDHEELLAHIISTRCPTGITVSGEDVTELSVGTSANGFTLKTILRMEYDNFTGALLHTPNHVLQCDDLTQGVRTVRGDRRSLLGQRLSWFWLQDLRDDQFEHQFTKYPQGMNAFFPPQSLTQQAIDENPLPSPFIVNYTFAVAVVQQWGVNAAQIEKHPNHRPPPEEPEGTILEAAAAEEPDAAPFDPYEVLLTAPLCVPGARERLEAREESRRAAEAAAELQEQQRVEASVSQWLQKLDVER